MPRLATLLLLTFVLTSLPVTSQGLVYVLGGFPVANDVTAENTTKLGIPVVELGLETRGFGPARARVTVHYGLDWALFRDPCAACYVPGLLEADPAKNRKRPPIGASADLKAERGIGNRVALGIFTGGGLVQSQQGDLDPDVPDDYRVETHISPFVTAGIELTVNLLGRLDMIGRSRFSRFSVGEKEITMRYERTPTQFNVDNGNVSGIVLMLGLRVRSR
jgi:hypothetical protein